MAQNTFKHINTYNKGMNKDLSPRLYDNQHYLDAEWMSPISNEANKVGPLTNLKGNLQKFQLPAGHVYINSVPLRDKLVIFSYVLDIVHFKISTYIFLFKDDGTSSVQTPDMSGLGDVTHNSLFGLVYSDDNLYHTVPLTNGERLLQYGDHANLQMDLVIRYESDTIQKVYFADGIHPLRYINIIYDPIKNNYTTFSQKDFNIIPNVSLGTISFNSYTSGSIPAGVIFYTYQLYKVNGTETAFSETSEPILLSSTVTKSTTLDLKGSELESNTGIGVNLDITSLDTSFNRIRCIAIHYSEYEAEPTLRIFFEGSYSTSSISVVDSGISLGVYDLAEFRTLNQFYIIPQLLTSKNNILFAGNIKEKYFDLDEYLIESGQTALLTTDAGGTGKQFWDSRSYRFNIETTPTCRLYEYSTDNNPLSLFGPTPSYDNIPYNYDCRNRYNDTSLNGLWYTNPTKSCKYTVDGSYGSSGKNVEMIFNKNEHFILDDNAIYETYSTSLTNEVLGRKRGYQHDEIYRYYIQFRDNKGRESFPKWIIDARTLDYLDDNSGFITESGGTVYAHHIYPKFKVNNLPLNDDGTNMNWRILRVDRTNSDKTVLGNCLVGFTLVDYYGNHDTELYCASRLTDAYDYQRSKYRKYTNSDFNYIDRTHLQLYFPETFFMDLNLDNAYLNHQGFVRSTIANPRGVYRTMTGSGTWTTTPSNLGPTNDVQVVRKITNFDKTTSTHYISAYSNKRLINIDKWKKIEAQPASENYDRNLSYASIAHKRYLNKTYWDNGDSTNGEHGTHIIIQTDGRDAAAEFGFTGLTSADAHKHIFCILKRDASPYGGESYYSRLNNNCIPASEYSNLENTYVTAYYGDVTVSYFDYIRSLYTSANTDSDTNNSQEVLYFPVESQVNLNFRSDRSFHDIANMDQNNRKLTEQGLVDVDNGIELSQLYRYNTVYSISSKASSYSNQPFDAVTTYNYDSRIRRSDPKTNEEYADSWLKFRLSNVLDVDSQYGPLTKLAVFKDKLLFWQPNATGMIPVGEKELIPSSTSSSLALGSSGIMDRYDYIDTFAGISDRKAAVITPNSILMYSIVRNTMYRYLGGLQPISDITGMNSWFDQYVTASNRIISGYNPILYEVWFTFGSNTIVYSEMGNGFLYRLPSIIVPYHYITHNNSFYSLGYGVSNLGYKHNIGNHGQLYDQYVTSSVQILVNPRGIIMNIYDVVEMLTEKYNNAGTELQSTFDSIRIFNDYQDTGTITLTPDENIKRRLRTWRFNTIRDNETDDPKMRSSYVIIELKFLNNANTQLIMHNLITNYKLSKMMY